MLFAFLKKEFIYLVRSKMILLVYLVPILILFLFGYGIKLQVEHIRTVIVDYDKSVISNEIKNKFIHSKYFSVIELNSEKKAFNLLKNGKKDLVIIFPQNFSKDLIHKNAEVGVFIDGAFPMRGELMKSYVEGVFINSAKVPLKVEVRNFYNQSLRDYNAIVPGLIGLTLLVAPAILAALTIVKEKEEGTIFNFYSSPLTKFQFLLAKLTPVFVLHSLNIYILLLMALYLFDVPFRGSFLMYMIASEIYVLISVGIGVLISIITSTQVAALILSVLITVIPGFLYSGILMPISSMAKEAFIQAHIFPVMYYNHLVYDSFLGGLGFSGIKNIEYLAILFLYAFLILFIGWALLKKGER